MAPTAPPAPFGTRISASRPPLVAGTSIVALSVSISKRFSPGATLSPTALNQWVIVPSATVSPSCGIRTSIKIAPSLATVSFSGRTPAVSRNSSLCAPTRQIRHPFPEHPRHSHCEGARCHIPCLPIVSSNSPCTRDTRSAFFLQQCRRTIRAPDEDAAPASRASPAHGNVLGLEELHQALVRALGADAALLHAAERRRRIRHEPAV